jgi:hypothetical protein
MKPRSCDGDPAGDQHLADCIANPTTNEVRGTDYWVRREFFIRFGLTAEDTGDYEGTRLARLIWIRPRNAAHPSLGNSRKCHRPRRWSRRDGLRRISLGCENRLNGWGFCFVECGFRKIVLRLDRDRNDCDQREQKSRSKSRRHWNPRWLWILGW